MACSRSTPYGDRPDHEPSSARRRTATFTDRLARVLRALPNDGVLILTVVGRHRFVQFARQGRAGLRAECVHDQYLRVDERYTASQRARLESLGWQDANLVADAPRRRGDPRNGSPNWHRDARGRTAPERLARLAARTIAEVFDVPRTVGLTYTSFRVMRGDALAWPQLGVRRGDGDDNLDREKRDTSDEVLDEARDQLLDDAAADPSTAHLLRVIGHALDAPPVRLAPRLWTCVVEDVAFLAELDRPARWLRLRCTLFVPPDREHDVHAVAAALTARAGGVGGVSVSDGHLRYELAVPMLPADGVGASQLLHRAALNVMRFGYESAA